MANVSKDSASFDSYVTGYPDFVLTAGNAVRGLSVNLTHYLFFALWPQGAPSYALVGNGSGGYQPQPAYYWYSMFAPNITSGQLFSTSTRPSPHPSFGAYLQGPLWGSLIVVNANATENDRVSWTLPLSLAHGGKILYWSNATAGQPPTVVVYKKLPSSSTLGPASVLLVDVNTT
jgi:hypothetical protein